MKDMHVSNIKNWRRETQHKDKWRKTINHGVTYSIAHTDTTRIVREHKEKAMNRRARETPSHQIKQNTTRPISNDMAPTNDDAKCTQCGKVCKNRKVLKIHQCTCLKKTLIDKKVDTQGVQKSASTIHHRITISRPMKIIELLLKNNNNEYICINQTCSRPLKTQETTGHVKAYAKSWLKRQNVTA